jgi:hypothetical protein
MTLQPAKQQPATVGAVERGRRDRTEDLALDADARWGRLPPQVLDGTLFLKALNLATTARRKFSTSSFSCNDGPLEQIIIRHASKESPMRWRCAVRI